MLTFFLRTASGFIIITFGIGARCIVQCTKGNMFWLSICNREMTSPKFSVLFVLQVHGISLPFLVLQEKLNNHIEHV